jgi:hypothetical protein
MRSICSVKTANARSTGALTTTSLRTDPGLEEFDFTLQRSVKKIAIPGICG